MDYLSEIKFPIVRRVYPTLVHNKDVEVQPMSKPLDNIFYNETLINGKTQEQIFQEDLNNGIWKYVGKETKIRVIRKPRIFYVLDGPKQSPMPIEKVIEVKYSVYENTLTKGYTSYRDTERLRQWTPEEWELVKNEFKDIEDY